MVDHPLFISLTQERSSSPDLNLSELEEEKKYHQFRIDEEIPFLPEWEFFPLYKNDLSETGKIFIIRFSDNYLYGNNEIIAQFDSSLEYSKIILEARKEYLKKFNQGFRPYAVQIEDNFEPMLAIHYKPGKTRLKFPVAVAPKLPGVRCLIRNIPNRPCLYRSRQNKEIHFLNKEFDHELNQIFPFLPGNVEIDSQLLLSGRSLKNSTQISSEMTPNLLCYISDFATSELLPFDQRYAILSRAFQRAKEMGFSFQRLGLINFVLASNEQELEVCKMEYQKIGYLGIMIYRLPGQDPSQKEIEASFYKSKRCSNLLKFE